MVAKIFPTLLLPLGLASGALSNTIPPRHPSAVEPDTIDVLSGLEPVKRATPQAPNGYAPASVDCPSTRPSIRSASGLSSDESSWLQKRRPNTIQPLREFLVRMNITGFDAGAYIDAHSQNFTAIPNIGIAASGGGYRAMLNGAGAIAAFDSRTPNSTNTGHIGGLLQSATYLAGLSGGGWLVGSLFTNNFTSVYDIMTTTPEYSGSLWQFKNSILEGPDKGAIQLLSTAEYYSNLHDTVTSKSDAGFNTSITDIWARALSFQLVNATDGGPAYTWSSIADDTGFSAGNTPMPVLVADGRAPGEVLISLNSTVYEMNPWEMGSWDSTVRGFAPMRYVGSKFLSGSLPDSEKCIRGFDNAAYIMGTSSSLFNQFILRVNSSGVSKEVAKIATAILTDLGNDSDDIADWTPNPFYGWNNQSNPTSQSHRLTIVDGGEDQQNIPLYPLIQPVRDVDVIFAIDSTANTKSPGANWPNGTSLLATYTRTLNTTLQNATFPLVPDANTFINLGLNSRPTFFGCDASNFTGTPPPLIVYLPNHPYVYYSNTSTFKLSYKNEERNAMIENGYMIATMGNSTVDSQWPQCVGCAVMSRSWTKTGGSVPAVCTQCFQRYCWNGTVNSTTPNTFEPSTVMAQIKAGGAERLFASSSLLSVVVALATTAFVFL